MLAKKSFLLVSLIVAILIAAPAKAELIYAGGSGGGPNNVVYKYSCGTSWKEISQDLGTVLCLCVYEGRLYAGTTTAAPAILGSQADIGTESLTSKKQLLLSRALSSTEIGRVWRYDGGTEWTVVGDNLDNQVCSLAVFRGNLYAGTAWDVGKLYMYDEPNWVNVVEYTRQDGDPPTPWNGFRSLYVWNDLLYIGDYGHDLFGHYDGNEFTYDDEIKQGSCIWDFEAYDSNLYASAYLGRVHMSPDGNNWTTIRDFPDYNNNSWELETFQGYLYVTTGPNLERYDGNNFSTVWTEPTEPNGYEIISMISTGDALILGTGEEAGSGYGVQGIGKVYSYDGSGVPQLISGDMGSGIQALLVTALVQLKKVDINEPNCIGPGGYITYTIDYNNIGGTAFNDVNIIDYLPPEVDFNSASDNWIRPEPNIVVWNIGTLSPGDTNYFTLTVKVRPDPGGTIINRCVVESNGIPIDGACEYTPVCIPTLSKTDISDGNCVIPDVNITYDIRYDANGYGDTNVLIIDYLPPEVNFISAVPPPNEVNGPIIIWNIGTLEPNESNCIELIVRVNGNAKSETTFINDCELTSGEQVLASAEEDTNVCPLPTLTKVDVNDGDCVSPDVNITYNIRYDANSYGYTNVEITDYLPPEVNFISAVPPPNEVNGPNIIWKIGTLEPNDSNCIKLTVRVNENAVPDTTFINVCNLTSDGHLLAHDAEDTNVCYWYCCQIYVDANAIGDNNGTSWQNAYKYLQDALSHAEEVLFPSGPCPCVEIRVADGVYRPDEGLAVEPNDRQATFGLINNVAIYGSYAGFGADDPNARNIQLYPTILSGDLDGNDTPGLDPCDLPNDPNRGENSYHVVTASDTNETAILDGFTITAGNAKYSKGGGGGIYSENGSPTITNCMFSGNIAIPYAQGGGGGMYSENGNPTITNCTFSGNTTTGYSGGGGGGGIYNDGGSLTITNCTFSGNTTTGYSGGGGMYNSNSSLTITSCIFRINSASSGGGMYNSGSSDSSDLDIINCIFIGNSATSSGGGMYNDDSNSTITNCIFSENSADSGGGMSGSGTITNCMFTGNSAASLRGGGIDGSSTTVTNCIVWGNEGRQIHEDCGDDVNVTYSDIQCGWPGIGNIDDDPMLEPNDYHLTLCSPCIDAGNNNPLGGLPPTDIDGQQRVRDGDNIGDAIVDMGADECYLTDVYARRPKPACETIVQPLEVNLMWRPGDLVQDVNGHEVYFGTDFNDVNTGTVPDFIVSDPCVALGTLEFAMEYFWRVDEVNEPTRWPGDMWSFTTANYLVIDDFERYKSRDELKAVWIDGYYSFLNGSNITLSTVIDYRYPAGHQPPGPIYEGSDALQFVYDNDKSIWIYVPCYESYNYIVWYYYSEMEATIDDLQCVSDWTTKEVEMLSLYFSGDPDNDIGTYEQMYIAVEDGDGDLALVKYGDSNGEDVNNLLSREWTEWAIDLQEFIDANANLDLNDVNKVYIGFGERYNNHTAGGSGVVYFDSIRLYRPKCVPAMAPVSDLTDDCTIDLYDFTLLADSWHGEPPNAVPIIDLDASDFNNLDKSWPNTDGMLGGQFDINLADFNDNPTTGTIDGLPVVTFDGNDYLIANFNAPGGITGASDFTAVIMIFNPTVADEEHIFTWSRRGEPNGTNAAVGYGLSPTSGAVVHWGEDDMGFDSGVPAFDMWHEIAVTYDGLTEKVLVDGKLKAAEGSKILEVYADDPVVVGASYYWDPNDPNNFVDTTLRFSGSVNRIRVYDEGLPQHQLEYIATGKFSADLNSDGEVDFKDLAIMVGDWLKEKLFP